MAEALEAKQALVGGLQTALNGHELSVERAKEVLVARPDTATAAVVGQALRVFLDSLMEQYSSDKLPIDRLPLHGFMEILLWACEEGLIDAVMVVTTLEDLFNALSVTHCFQTFDLLETNRERIRLLLQAGRKKSAWCELTLLRFCNDLVRRVSKCCHVEFCGRVLCLLSYMLDLTARSGVNPASGINDGNVTEFEQEEPSDSQLDKPDQPADDKEEGEADERPVLDFAFYQTLWGLQRFLHKADDAHKPEHWKEIVPAVDSVLNAFASYCSVEPDAVSRPFACTKFLSSSPLLKLQMSDSGFRQHLLVQILVFLHTLLHPITRKGSAVASLAGERLQWAEDTFRRVRKILRDTGANGQAFVDCLDHLLRREQNWVAWKSETPPCPAFERYPSDGAFVPANADVTARRVRARKTQHNAVMAKAFGKADEVVGKLSPEEVDKHLVANFKVAIPSVGDLVNDMEEDDDPEAMIEDAYKRKNNPIFQWRAQRIIAATDMQLSGVIAQANGDVSAVVRHKKAKAAHKPSAHAEGGKDAGAKAKDKDSAAAGKDKEKDKDEDRNKGKDEERKRKREADEGGNDRGDSKREQDKGDNHHDRGRARKRSRGGDDHADSPTARRARK